MTSDADAWRAVLSGDKRAFGVIWDRHRDRVFAHLVMRGAAPADAEDLTAAVFLELWRRRDAIRLVDDSVAPWLMVTGHNVVRNAGRARRRYRRFLATLPAAEDTPDHAESFLSHRDARTAQVVAEIGRARQADAALLSLTALEGFTVREAAAAVGISESAARMRLSRFRTHLRASAEASVIEGEGT